MHPYGVKKSSLLQGFLSREIVYCAETSFCCVGCGVIDRLRSFHHQPAIVLLSARRAGALTRLYFHTIRIAARPRFPSCIAVGSGVYWCGHRTCMSALHVDQLHASALGTELLHRRLWLQNFTMTSISLKALVEIPVSIHQWDIILQKELIRAQAPFRINDGDRGFTFLLHQVRFAGLPLV